MKEYSLYFAFCKLSISCEKENFELPEYLKEFLWPIDYHDGFNLVIREFDEVPKRYYDLDPKSIVCHTERFDLYDVSDYWVFCENEHESGQNSILVCARDYKNMTLYMANDHFPSSSLIRVACESGITKISGLPLHASLVEKDGRGIVFLGPSGMGKSTQAKLWKQYENADFFSGDRPALFKIDGIWYGCGMPWDGKDGLFRQKMVPVRALISLEQAKVNKLTRLNSMDSMKVLLNQVMMPMWDQAAMDDTSSLMWQLANDVEFYHLQNRADQEAVDLVRAMTR
ncbi:MAG: hypothetical protein K5929_08495 [Lachnospiraceae bacterium]|nr:hypothetical protein [Lachnospiraceae bacterium]